MPRCREKWWMLALYCAASFYNCLISFSYAPFDGADDYLGSQHVSTKMVQLYLVSYSITSILAMCIVEVHGLSVSLRVGATLQALAAVTRVIPFQSQTDGITIAYISQVVAGSCQGFFINTPAEFSNVWFRKRERVIATAIGVNINTLGISGAYILGGITNYVYRDLPQVEILKKGLVIHAVLGCIIASLILIYMGPPPPKDFSIHRRNSTRTDDPVHHVFISILKDVCNAIYDMTIRPKETYSTYGLADKASSSHSHYRIRKHTGIFSAWAMNRSHSIVSTPSSINSQMDTHLLMPLMDTHYHDRYDKENDAPSPLLKPVSSTEQQTSIVSKSRPSISAIAHKSTITGYTPRDVLINSRDDTYHNMSYWTTVIAFTTSEIVINVFSSDAANVLEPRNFSRMASMLYGGGFILTSVISSAILCFGLKPHKMRNRILMSLGILLFASCAMIAIDMYGYMLENESIQKVLYGACLVLMGVVVGPIQGMTVELAAETSYPFLNENLSGTVLQIVGNFVSSIVVGGVASKEGGPILNIWFAVIALIGLLPFAMTDHHLTRSTVEIDSFYDSFMADTNNNN